MGRSKETFGKKIAPFDEQLKNTNYDSTNLRIAITNVKEAITEAREEETPLELPAWIKDPFGTRKNSVAEEI